jgi:peptidylprolyl isomerase
MGRLDGKVAAITGGASGIGEATLRRFVAEGAKVAFTQANVGSEAACLAFVNEAAENFGCLEILVNNAGIRKYEKIDDTSVGTGASPRGGQTCVMHYTGWLYEGGGKGHKFDSSVDRGSPFEFPIGLKRVIAGWDEGVATMKVGGKRNLIIPPQLGYGERGAGGLIPPNATLMFDVELLAIK